LNKSGFGKGTKLSGLVNQGAVKGVNKKKRQIGLESAGDTGGEGTGTGLGSGIIYMTEDINSQP